MLLNDELRASFSQPTKTIVLHHVEPSSLQNAAMKYTAKVAALLESNEALLESRYFAFGGSASGAGNAGGGSGGGKNDGKDGDYKNSNRGAGGSSRRGGASGGSNNSNIYDDEGSSNRPKRR